LTYAELTGDPWRGGAGSVVAEVMRLRDAHHPTAIIVDAAGPVKFAVPDLLAAKVELTKVTYQENAQACSGLLDAVTVPEPTFRHRNQSYVRAALAGAKKKDLGDGWVLDRRRSSSDVTPLEVLALARWGFVKFGQSSDVTSDLW
jgi:hypothetical protein